MMLDIKARIIQKNVVLVLKVLSHSKKVREQMINQMAFARYKLLSYLCLSSMHLFKEVLLILR